MLVCKRILKELSLNYAHDVTRHLENIPLSRNCLFLALGTVRRNISIIKILPGYWDYVNIAFLTEMYVTVMFNVPRWLLTAITWRVLQYAFSSHFFKLMVED